MNKKIVFITSSFPFGESEIWAFNEIDSTIKLGNQVTIIPRTGKGKIINKDTEKFISNLIDLPFLNWEIFTFFVNVLLFKPFLFLKIINGNLKQSNNPKDFIKGLIVLPKSFFIAKMLVNKKIDHIHSLQTTSTAFMAFTISYLLKVPWSFTLHTSEIVNSQYKRSFKFRSDHATICRTISKRTADDLSNFLGPHVSDKIINIPLGVDVKVIKKKISSSNNIFTIATPAKLIPRKGHVFSIEAAKKLIDLGINDFKWFFFGSGPLLNELKKKVKNLNLSKHCFFLGNLDHDQLIYKYRNNEIDAVIISSLSKDVPEGIPVSLMEAMSYEIPVIATDCGGTKELVDGKSGILINQSDPEAIVNAIQELIKKPDFRKKIALNGRKKVSEDFDTIKNTYDLINLF